MFDQGHQNFLVVGESTRHSAWWKIGAFLFALGGVGSLTLATLFAFRFSLFSAALASGPSSNRVLNYQIRLTDSSGIPVADGTKNIKISFYDAASGGTTLHTDCGTTVTPVARKVVFSGGVGTVLIGETTADGSHNCSDASAPNALPATLFNATSLFLGITVDADAEMTPRKRVVAQGYSLNADRLDDLETSAVGGAIAFVPVTDVSGNLVLTQNLTVDGTTLFVNAANNRVGVGTVSADKTLTVSGDISAVGSFSAGAGADFFGTDLNQTIAAGANNQVISLMRLRHRGSDGVFTGVRRPLLISENSGGGQHYVQLFESGLRVGPYFSVPDVVTPAANIELDGFTSDAAAFTMKVENLAGTDIFSIRNDGNIGIGTFSPATALDLSGALSVREMAAPALSPTDQGRLYFDATSNKFRVSENGGAYVDLVSAAAASGWTDDGTVVRLTTVTDNVGIGTASAAQKLVVKGQARIGENADTYNDFGSPYQLVINADRTDTSGFIFGTHSRLYENPASASTASVFALNGTIDLDGANNFGDATGVSGTVEKLGTGNAVNMRAMNAFSFNNDGNVTNMFAIRSLNQTTGGAITNAYGLQYQMFANGGTVTNSYGVKIESPSTAGGAITNNYGIHIDPMTGGTTINNAILYNHGTVPFAVKGDGNVGIGTSSPRVLFEARKDQNAVTNTYVANATSGSGAGSAYYLIHDDISVYSAVIQTSPGWTTNGLSLPNQMQIQSQNGNTGGIEIGTNAAGAPIVFSVAPVAGQIYFAASERMRIGSTEIAINDNQQNVDFRIEGDGDANLLFADASTDRLGVGVANPANFKLEVGGSIGPSTDDTHDLGSNALRWRDLYLGPASLHIGTSTTDEGVITYDTATNKLQIDTTAGGSVDIAGGSGSSGCSVDASGNFTCSGSVSGGGAGTFVNGGNSFGGAATLGTNDNFGLNLETNGTTKLTVQNDGDVDIGSGKFFFDTTNRILGIGSSDPFNDDLDGSGAIYIQGAGSTEYVGLNMFSAHAGLSPVTLGFFGSRGTVGAKTAVAHGDRLGVINFAGYDGANLVYGNSIRVEVQGVVASGIAPGVMRFSVADQSGTVGGVERMRIEATGLIGLSEQAPQAMLHLGPLGQLAFEGSSADLNETFITVANPTADRTITFQDSSGTVAFLSDLGGSAGGWTDDGTVVRLTTATDSVGIGTTGPNAPLEVRSQNTATVIYTTQILGAHDTDSIGANGLGSMIEFQIEDSVSTNQAQAAQIQAVWEDATSSSRDASIRFITAQNTSLVEAMRIDDGNNVGIGDTTPLATLTVGNGDLFQVAGASGNVTTSGDLALNGGDLTSTAATFNLINNTAATSVNIGAAMTTGAIVIGGTGAQSGTIAIGAGTGVGTVTIGSSAGTGSLTFGGSTGIRNINIGGSGANTIAIGNTQIAGSVSIGNAMTTGTVQVGSTGAQSGAVSIAPGTGTGVINIGNSTGTGAITIGGTGARTVNIASGAAQHVVTLGSTTANSTLTLSTGGSGIFSMANGTGGYSITTAATSATNGISYGANNVQTGNAFNLTSSGLTTGSALFINSTNTLSSSAPASANTFGATYVQSSVANTAGFNAATFNLTSNPSIAGNTENIVRIQNQVTANTTDTAVSAGLLIDNADTSATGSTVITNAINITASGGLATPYTNYFNAPNFSITNAGLVTTASNVAVNGGDLTTLAATANLFNLNATTVNVGGATTTLNLAGGSGSTGCTIDASGNLACSGTVGSPGWTDDGTVVRLTTVTDSVGIGTASPITQLHVAGKVPTGLTGSVATGLGPINVAVQGRYAYTANISANTLQIFDVSNPATPVSVGSVATGTSPYAVYVSGRFAYVVNNSSSTLQIFDVSNAASPSLSGSVATGSGPVAVYVQGRFAYVTNVTADTLQIIDVSNPASPSVVGSVATGVDPRSIVVQGRYAYVTNNNGGAAGTLQIFDVSDPAAPASVGTVATGDSPYHVQVQGRYAYVVNEHFATGNTLQIFDIKNPAAPSSVSVTATLNRPIAVSVQGRYAYVANFDGNNIQTFDVSNPAAPVSVGSVATASAPRAIVVQGRYALVVNINANTLNVYDLGGGYVQQLEAGGIETGSLAVRTNMQAVDAALTGGLTVGQHVNVTGRLGVRGDASVLGNVGIGTASPITQLHVPIKVPTAAAGSVATGTFPTHAFVQGRYAYVTNYTSGTLQIFDASNPASPASVGTVATGTNPVSVHVQGRYAYVANYGSDTLRVVDVSNPASPVAVGSVATGVGPTNVRVQGRYAFVVHFNAETLQVFDVSNPVSPVSVGSAATGTSPKGLSIQGRYAFVTNSGSGTLQAFDVSNPSAPTSVGTSPSSGTPGDVYVQGRYAYVANEGTATLQIYDISNPASIPAAVGSVASGSSADGIYVQGRTAFMTNRDSNTLQFVDVSNPASPSSLGTVTTGSSPRKLYVQGRYAYVPNGTGNTLQTFDLGGSYVQQFEAGGIETGTLAVRNSVQALDAAFSGGVAVGQHLNVSGHLGVQGDVKIVGPSYTALSASTEHIDVDMALNRTVQFATGSLATQRAFVVRQPTYAFAGASTLAVTATMNVMGSPVAGTNATLTNAIGLLVGDMAEEVSAASRGIGTMTLVPGITNGTGAANLRTGLWVTTPIGEVSLGNQTATLTDYNTMRVDDITLKSTTNTRTVTNAASLFIRGAPIVGTNVSVTNGPYSIFVDKGLSRFDAQAGTVAIFNRETDDGTIISLQQDGTEEGSISVSGTTISYNAFTGSHYAWTDEQIERGMLVRFTGNNRRLHGDVESEILYGIAPTSSKNDPTVLGAYLALKEPNQPAGDENPHLVMAVGNADLWVVDEGEDIAPGDYLMTSDTAGHAMKDEGTEEVSHIIARAAEAVDWSTVTETVGGKKHKKISITFVNFTRREAPETSELTIEGDVDFKGYGIENVSFLRGLNGTWSIDESGKLVIQDIDARKVKTQELLVNTRETDKTVGRETILAGQVGKLVLNPKAKANSVIVVTFEGNVGTTWWVDEKNDGSFMVKLATPAVGDVNFVYWIIGVDGELGTPPPPPSPAPAPEPEPEPTPEPTPEPEPQPEPEPTPEPAPEPQPEP